MRTNRMCLAFLFACAGVLALASCSSGSSHCTPDCGSRVCGPVPNGCGDSCGSCQVQGESCNQTSGQCEATTITVDTIGGLALGAFCDLLAKCQSELGPSFPTRDRCAAILELALADVDLGAIFQAAGTSFYQVDKIAAAACLQKLAAAACSEVGATTTVVVSDCGGGQAGSGIFSGLSNLLKTIPECVQALTGTLAQGACCDHRGGCAPNLSCEQPGGQENTGTCLPTGADGDSCWTRPCQANLVCLRGGAVPTCRPYAQLGQDCSSAGSTCGSGLYCDSTKQPASCATANLAEGAQCQCNACAPGLYCALSVSPPVCHALKTENQSCNSSDRCISGLGCMGGTCQKELPLSLGDPCDPSFDWLCPGTLSGGICADDGTGTKRCLAPGLSGQDCNPALDFGQSCAAFYDLVCDPTTKKCTPMPGLNQSCKDYCADFVSNYCAYGSPSDPSGTCQPRVGLNQDCSHGLTGNDIRSACQVDQKCDATSHTCVPGSSKVIHTCP